ncbi:helix-turn-helix domain-containing protein [Mucilaginibacter lutimaris]|uniref:Helix-turn-helix domain-containing protein n=1 Tax=Mucilaginibacter lutimaris TaxID=931629 RepID=A0ABW2ZJ16_9SPHI
MIKNNRQFAAAQERLTVLKAELEDHFKNKDTMRPYYFESKHNTHKEMIDKLQQDIDAYNALLNGNVHFFVYNDWSELSDVLISARIHKRMSQKELAEKLGIAEQQIQRYESTDYQGAGWSRLLEIFKALGLRAEGNRVNFETDAGIFLNPPSVDDSMKEVFKRQLRSEKTFDLAGV